ncbi:hypothetical protein CKO28_00430 [Rhodovibrio sodomensis]|uniref:Uncharacterized protein n=1 Tax=Rhodovibrio sodomensis TaxID=1088 RepID=A0ABS1D955_9PROT|nr:hypothetical protein [Rhodovibrio sodomensis]MBK1666506.1 hypothetical protein [Rhodovibrio sodomensis]
MTTIHLDKPKATQMARNLASHLAEAHSLKLSHAQSLTALARTLGYNEVQVMNRDLKLIDTDQSGVPDVTALGDTRAPARLDGYALVILETPWGDDQTLLRCEDAFSWLASFCLERWEREDIARESGVDDPTTLSDMGVVQTFFDHASSEFDYQVIDIDLSTTTVPTDRVSQNPIELRQLAPGKRRPQQTGWAVRCGQIVREGDRFASDAEARAYVERLAERHEPFAAQVIARLEDARPFRYVMTGSCADGDAYTLWQHHFSAQHPPSMLRWVWDRVEERLVIAQVVDDDGGAQPLTEAAHADLEESLAGANADALEAPENWSLNVDDTMPPWAVKAMRES